MSENRHADRRRVDQLIDARKRFQPWNDRPVNVNLSMTELLEALEYPVPRDRALPQSVTYRGYRLVPILPPA